MMTILTQKFYLNDDVVGISQALLGKFLVTRFGGQLTAGMIVETEAYRGAEDKASHAYNHRRTARTETMYQAGGIGYVYLCYGIHHLFNVVTAQAGTPHAVLIRAVEPVDGISTMIKRRNMKKVESRLTAGPGVLSQALGITTQIDGCSLIGDRIWIEDRGIHFAQKQIIASPRVGIDYAQEHKLLPWRFRVKDSPWTSTSR
ncbi:MAG: DNA-3-methyladenine glycosylase [Candidatus Berkiella sp.]